MVLDCYDIFDVLDYSFLSTYVLEKIWSPQVIQLFGRSLESALHWFHPAIRNQQSAVENDQILIDNSSLNEEQIFVLGRPSSKEIIVPKVHSYKHLKRTREKIKDEITSIFSWISKIYHENRWSFHLCMRNEKVGHFSEIFLLPVWKEVLITQSQ